MHNETLELKWDKSEDSVSITFIEDQEQTTYSGDPALLTKIPSLPRAIGADEPVASVAAQYQDILRGFRRAGRAAPGPNAMERLSEKFGTRHSGVVNIRLTANDHATELLGFPWELLLHDSEVADLRDKLANIAIVRSLGKTIDYHPNKMEDRFRVLLLQGAAGNPALNLEAERKTLDYAWSAIGKLLSDRIRQPKVFSAKPSDLATHLVAEKPHLLWFSGHGRQHGQDFELLFEDGQKGVWRSVSVLSQAVEEAKRQTNQVPLITAFWACDGALSSPATSSLDAGNPGFPILVDTILKTGVEAVLGVQTQVYDSTARTMGESFFRAIAEGYGPAIALAGARADLHRNPSRGAPGSRSEWTSPVLWTNGADIPLIHWATPIENNEAIVLHRLGRESLLAVEGGRDVLAEPSDLKSPGLAHGWCQSAPIWLISRDLHLADRQLSIIRELRQLVLTEKKTVLLVNYDNIRDKCLLGALTRSFQELRGRIFPGLGDEAMDLLVSLFQAFAGGNRKDAWLRLLRQPELVVAVFAEGGVTIDDDLAPATSSAAKIIVVSNREATAANGNPPDLSKWKVDNLIPEDSSPPSDEAISGFLVALSILDKPLTADAISLFGRDYGLDTVESVIRNYMARFGERYVVRASVATRLLEHAKDDERRAAHRACMNFLARLPTTVDANHLTHLAWRLAHTLKAEEPGPALPLGEEAIRKGHSLGNYIYVLDSYAELGALRKQLPNSRKIDVAFAQTQMGQAQRAYDLLRQIPLDSIKSPAERIRYAANEAEALRNFQDRDKHQQSIVTLENALRKRPERGWSIQDKRWWLVARQDLARNLHYFAKDVTKARSIFLDIVKKSTNNPAFAYVKAAALRNLSDIYYNYGFGKVAPDEAKAEQYLGHAITTARRSSDTASLLPEFLYLLAKLQHAQGRTGDAGANIHDAIARARTGGLARILLLATNKSFWWELGTLTVANCKSFDYFKWQRIEERLQLLSQDPWVGRALVSSRVRAAKCLDFQSKKMVAVGLLQEAKAQLEATNLFEGEGDFRRRWQPVFAGLALLNAPSPAHGTDRPLPNYDDKIWNQLKQIGQRITGNTNPELAKPQQVWEGVA
jgi:hypothetical protein